MLRTAALVALAVLLAGCTRYQTRESGPFARVKKELPPPYGAIAPRPVGGQSPLGMASADLAPPLPPDEQRLIPSRSNTVLPASGTVPQPAPDPSAKNRADLKALVATSREAWNRVNTYELQLTRRELNPKGQINSEVLSVQYRREPLAVFTRNIGETGKGREIVYNPRAHDDKLYVKLGKGDPLPGAGFIAPPISPDDAKVKERSRYSIREAGFGRWISALAATVAKAEAGLSPPDAVTFNGEVKREEYPYPLVGVSHKLRPGDDPLLLNGGQRLYFFDMRTNSPSYGLPVLIVAFDAAGKEVEYYLTEKMNNSANLTDANFNPARLGK